MLVRGTATVVLVTATLVLAVVVKVYEDPSEVVRRNDAMPVMAASVNTSNWYVVPAAGTGTNV
jgi:hypothetical protein